MPNNTKQLPREEKVTDLITKEVFYYFDDEQSIKVKSREVYKNGKKFVHFPFQKSDGAPKYRNCKRITYVGMTVDLPRGFLKKWNTGYGFTKIYNPLIYQIMDNNDINEIVVQNNCVQKIENRKLYLNPLALNRHYPVIDSLIKQQREDKSQLVNRILPDLLPDRYKKENRKYIKDTLSNYIKRNVDKDTILSDNDVQALLELVSFISYDKAPSNSTNVLKTKVKLEEYFIEEIIKEFEKLLAQKTYTSLLEKRWQAFFKKYSWIFSQLFSFPVLIFEDEAYTGGKNLQNRGGKFADFLYKNKLTNNIAFIEIKTHNTKILDSRSYRGNDVYAISSELSGALNQVLDQRENLQHEFYALRAKSKGTFESYNPKCLIIIGSMSQLIDEQKKSFELIRSNSRDVEIITFDEVLEKIKGIQSLMLSSK